MDPVATPAECAHNTNERCSYCCECTDCATIRLLDTWESWPVVHTYPRNRPVRDTVQSSDPAVYAHVYRYGSHRPRVQFFRTVDGIGQFIEERPL